MRQQMRITEQDIKKEMSERNDRADKLIEKFSRKVGVGDGLKDAASKDINRIRNTAIVLENQEKLLRNLTETQISTAFSTTPENVMRIVRLGYPNSVRGEVFLEWAMETMRDSIYYLKPIYESSLRDASAGAVTYESPSTNYPSEIELFQVDAAGAGTNFAGTISGTKPLRPFFVKLYLGSDTARNYIATDDGRGNLIGSLLSTTTASTIDYVTGDYDITFLTAPNQRIAFEYNFNGEVVANYPQLGGINLTLQDYQFRGRPFPLGISWSKMTELLLGSTLNIDAEDALIRGAADELKKALDFQALRMGYSGSLSNTLVNFNADFVSAGADSDIAHAQSFTTAIRKAGNVIYSALQRGGVTKMYGGPSACAYIEKHYKFTDAGKQPAVGAYKTGSLGDIDIYQVPSAIVPDNTFVCAWKNDAVPEDVSIALGTFVAAGTTQKIEFKNMYSENAIYHIGDQKILQPKYLVRIQLDNLDKI